MKSPNVHRLSQQEGSTYRIHSQQRIGRKCVLALARRFTSTRVGAGAGHLVTGAGLLYTLAGLTATASVAHLDNECNKTIVTQCNPLACSAIHDRTKQYGTWNNAWHHTLSQNHAIWNTKTIHCNSTKLYHTRNKPLHTDEKEEWQHSGLKYRPDHQVGSISATP